MYTWRASDSTANDYSACTGCGLCLLVCPQWWLHRDQRDTPLGWAKALQNDTASTAFGASAFEHCSLCGACEVICPERIGLLALLRSVRQTCFHGSAHMARVKHIRLQIQTKTALPAPPPPATSHVLLPGSLRDQPHLLARVSQLLGDKYSLAEDDAQDIAQALEVGLDIPKARLERFLKPLRRARHLALHDGILLHALSRWLPDCRILSLGEVLSQLPTVRQALRPTDLYVVEARAYHAGFERLAAYYAQLGQAVGCRFNLNLHRTATSPTPPGLGDAAPQTELLAWILKGCPPERIVVESWHDAAGFRQVSKVPVVHLAEVGVQ